jgi:multisubunit Na+/H+ antiporter MnhB subunit
MNGSLIDAIITITLLEVMALLLHRRKTKRGLKPREYLLNVVSGLCLMLALRCTLTGAAWYYISAWLAAAGLAHVADIALRLQQRAPTP